jgi:DNA/RNA endonuclease G (NUC1)
MDRFYYYLLGALIAVAVAALLFSRHGEVSAPSEPAPVFAKSTPKPTPAFASATPLAMATPIPLATPALFAPAQPTPVPWRPPNFGTVVTTTYPGFTIVYSETLGNPLAVQYAMVNGAKPRRWPNPNRVKTPDGRRIPAAGYARGQMALQRSIAMYFGKVAGEKTDMMANICAFTPACLAGPWAQFSELEPKWAGTFGWIEVVTGPVFSSPPAQANGLVIPSAFYRVYRRAYGDSLAFLIPQTATSTKLETYLTSISTIEAATGMSIFPNTLPVGQRDIAAKAVW